MRETSTNITQHLSDMPHASNPTESRVEKITLLMIIEHEKKLQELYEQLDDAILKITEKIYGADLTSQEKEILHLRYIVALQFNQIINRLHLSASRVFIIHRHALKKIKDAASFQ